MVAKPTGAHFRFSQTKFTKGEVLRRTVIGLAVGVARERLHEVYGGEVITPD
jgi:hypothetical protein